jgi:hypothetical protein
MNDASVRPGEARAEYEARLAVRQSAVRRAVRRDRALSAVRGATAVLALVLFWLAMGPGGISALWLLVPIALFALLVIVHDQVLRQRRLAEASVTHYEDGLARLEDRWAGRGNTGERFQDETHPYASDLDVFGRGGLFELLCTARTRVGEDTLASWLLSPAPPPVIRARQDAVRELTAALDLRESLARHGDSVRRSGSSARLVAWGGAPPMSFPALAGPLALLLAAANVAAAVFWALPQGSSAPLALTLVLSGLFAAGLRGKVQRVLGALSGSHDLPVLARALSCLEAEHFTAKRLVELRARLETDGAPPSQQVARFARLVDLLESRQNQFFLPFSMLLLWGTQLAIALEGWRARCGPRIADWVAVVGEMEALCALSAFSFENPGYAWPQVDEGGSRFEGRALAHPLLPRAGAVPNDVTLGEAPRLLLVSGSNMSGKSTLLRTVGVNLVLAQAGAPVRAAALVVSPLALGSSIRVHDSLQEGSSRFYAEIKRLRQVMELAAQQPPLLFLLDEILHGTNSSDRRVGAEAVIRGLLARGAFGLVTTHDLALAAVAEAMGKEARNVHFEDHVEEGRIAFDYRMRDGVVTRSNALALMRAVGLEV